MGPRGSVKDAGGGSGYSYPAASMASVIIDMIRSSQKAHISALAARAFGGGSPWMCGIQVSSVPFARITKAASRGAIRMVVVICSPCPRRWQEGLTTCRPRSSACEPHAVHRGQVATERFPGFARVARHPEGAGGRAHRQRLTVGRHLQAV